GVLDEVAVSLAARLDEARVGSLERGRVLAVPVEEDRQRGRVADRAQVLLAPGPDEDGLGSGTLRAAGLVGRADGCHERDAVPLGDRLAEAAGAGHGPAMVPRQCWRQSLSMPTSRTWWAVALCGEVEGPGRAGGGKATDDTLSESRRQAHQPGSAPARPGAAVGGGWCPPRAPCCAPQSEKQGKSSTNPQHRKQ